MTRARSELISLSDTPYYHCISRCVRRAFLCGVDHLTGNNYEHRKQWVVERLAELSQAFAIEIASYAVMSNHLHLVLRVNQPAAMAWSDEEIIQRWGDLYQLPVLIQRYQRGEANSQGEQKAVKDKLDEWRLRLSSISWYMRGLNEHLARRANAEDHCTGRFWEGRFKSQALLDEAAVLTCMSYVDLNPIRAAIAATPEASDFTSVQQRMDLIRSNSKTGASNRPTLMPLLHSDKDHHVNTTGYSLREYLELVDWAGRQIREDKRGAITKDVPPLLERLGLDDSGFLEFVGGNKPNAVKPRVIGAISLIKQAAENLGQNFLNGMGLAKALYLTSG
jgi:REP element-mobilizing transposase RayT